MSILRKLTVGICITRGNRYQFIDFFSPLTFVACETPELKSRPLFSLLAFTESFIPVSFDLDLTCVISHIFFSADWYRGLKA